MYVNMFYSKNYLIDLEALQFCCEVLGLSMKVFIPGLPVLGIVIVISSEELNEGHWTCLRFFLGGYVNEVVCEGSSGLQCWWLLQIMGKSFFDQP